MGEYNKIVAKIYDPILHLAIFRLRKKIAEISKQLNATKIIDLCCGTGNQLKYLRKQGFTDIIGVDLSKNMIKQASRGKYKVDCKLQDASNTSFSDASFDLIVITLALHEKPRDVVENILNESKRILKSSGYLIIADYCLDNKSFRIGKLAVRAIEKFAGGDHYRNFKSYLSKGGLDNIMEGQKYSIEQSFLLNTVRLRVYSL